MTLEEMKKIAEARTKGTWEWDGKFTVTIPSIDGRGQFCFRTEGPNAAFIAMCANNWDEITKRYELCKTQWEMSEAKILNLQADNSYMKKKYLEANEMLEKIDKALEGFALIKS